MSSGDKQWLLPRKARAPLHYENLRGTVALVLETRDAALLDDMFGGVERHDLVFGNCVAVRCVGAAAAGPDESLFVAELSVGAISDIPTTATAALIAEWLTRHARKRAGRLTIGGQRAPLNVGAIRRTLAEHLASARGR